MESTARIKAIITADDRASGVVKNFGNRVNSMGRVALGVAKKGFLALGAAGIYATKQFIDQEKAVTQLHAVLKSTGGAAGVTADQAIKLSESLQKTTTFADEAVLGAENLLLTFTKIGKKVFPQATEIVLDMSTALGQDLKSSAIQVGKALQDPVLGVTALRRVGVNFSNAQKEVIKKLVETGQSAKAQALIMKELQVEFGGSAKAAAQTLGGSLSQLKNSFGELAESVGGRMAPVIRGAAEVLKGWTEIIGGNAVPKLSLLHDSVNKVNAATTALKNTQNLAKASAEGVTQAQHAYNNAVAGYGPKSVEARKAHEQLRLAELKDAQARADVKLQQQLLNWEEARFINRTPEHLRSIQKRAVKMGLVVEASESAQTAIRDLDSLIGIVRKDALNLKDVIESTKPGGGLKIEGREHGGPIRSGQPYLVGEKGPELIVPKDSSNVVPNNKLTRSRPSTQTQIHFHIGTLIADGMSRRRFAEVIMRDLRDVASKQGTTATNLLAT